MEEINQTLELERKMAREEAKRDMKMYLANDWQLKEETPEYFLLTRNESSITECMPQQPKETVIYIPRP